MNEITKRNEIISLFEIYGDLLTTSQIEIINDYYFYDLSLSEIATNRHISRSAVEDALKKGEKKLYEYEKTLNVLSAKLKLKDLLIKAKNENNYQQLEEYINGI